MLCISTSPVLYDGEPQKAGRSRLSLCYRLTTADQVFLSPDDAALSRNDMPCSRAFICIGRADRCKGWVMPPVFYRPEQKKNPYSLGLGRGVDGRKSVKSHIKTETQCVRVLTDSRPATERPVFFTGNRILPPKNN